jgi:hypothetical protein
MGRRWIVGVLAAIVLSGVGWALARGSGSGLAVGRVAARVEQIRGLRFVRLPTVRLVSEAQIRAVVARVLPVSLLGPAASDFTRPEPASAVPVVERLEALELLGAVPTGTTLGQVLFAAGEDPGGLFEPRTGVIYVRRASGGKLGGEESVLAHELTHALEYQRHLHGAQRFRGFDQLEASRALIEGPAVLVQYFYARRYLGYHGALSQFLAVFSREARRVVRAPGVLLADAVFPYVDGALFVERLLSSGGWSAVSRAEREPPSGTQSILLGNRSGENDPKFDVANILGSGWLAEPRQTFGDYDTASLLAPGSLMPSPSLVDLWRGGSLQVWNDLGAANVTRCRRPCAAHFVLLASWRWARSSVAKAAANDLRRLLAPAFTGSVAGRGRLMTRLGSSVVITATHLATTIAMAPRPALANALAVANRTPAY